MRSIAKLFHVNAAAIPYWERALAIKIYEKPAPQGVDGVGN
jgi:hypothetical protein